MHINRNRQAMAALCLVLSSPFHATTWAADSCPLPAAKIKTESEAIDRAAKAVEAYKMGKAKLQCLAFMADKKKTGYAVDVLEVHNDACGGDPLTEPRAFSINVAWDGSMKSDVYDHATYQPLTCPKG